MAAPLPLNALTVDLEDYFQVSNFDDVVCRSDWDAQPRRIERNTRELLDAFDSYATRATFFVLGWVAEREPGLIREIADRGHEVACHGYGHELVYEIGAERFARDLQGARAAIEYACGRAVVGYRAPSYSITERSLWALDVLAEQGFDYDSSIFPIRHHRYGIPDFPRHPRRLVLPGGGRIDEFPMTTLPVGGTNLPLSGGAYLRFLPAPVFRWGFRRLARRGEPTVLYLHPWEIDPGQPRQDVGLAVRINHYWNLGRTLPRLRGLLSEHRFAPMADVLAELRRADRLPEHVLPASVPAPSEPLAANA